MFKNFRTYQNHLLTHKADSHNDTAMAIVEETEEETGHEERQTSLTLINESTVGPSIEAETTSNALEQSSQLSRIGRESHTFSLSHA